MVSKTIVIGSSPISSVYFNMTVKLLNPSTASSRQTIIIKHKELSKLAVIKKLKKNVSQAAGRSNSTGTITVRHKGGAVKHKKHLFLNPSTKSRSIILLNEYSSYQGSYLALNFDIGDRKFFYTNSSLNVRPGTISQTAEYLSDYKLGYRTKIKNIPSGSIISNIGDKNIKYIKAPGTFGILLGFGEGVRKVKLPSGKYCLVSLEDYATIGAVSNSSSNLRRLGKAGRSRKLGIRPTTRGIAMNPVDHPHGGRSNGGICSRTPWGLPTKAGFVLKRRSKLYGKYKSN